MSRFFTFLILILSFLTVQPSAQTYQVWGKVKSVTPPAPDINLQFKNNIGQFLTNVTVQGINPHDYVAQTVPSGWIGTVTPSFSRGGMTFSSNYSPTEGIVYVPPVFGYTLLNDTITMTDIQKPNIYIRQPLSGPLYTSVTDSLKIVLYDNSKFVKQMQLYYSVASSPEWVMFKDTIGDYGPYGFYALDTSYYLAKSSFPFTPQTPTSTFRLRVIAEDLTGNQDTAITPAITVLDTVKPTISLLSPIGGELWNTGSIHDIIWTATDNIDISSRVIDLSIDDGSSFIRKDSSSGVSPWSWTVPDMSTATACKIKITVYDNSGNSKSALSENFQIMDTTAPVITFPENNSVEVSLTPTLIWNGVPGATNYKIEMDTVSEFTSNNGAWIWGSYSGTSLGLTPVQNLAKGETYYVRIRVVNGVGFSNWSPTMNFSTIQVAPIAPTLVSPANGVQNLPTTLRLTWNKIPNVSTYNFNGNYILPSHTGIIDTFIDLSGLSNLTTYRWSISATNSSGTGPWSAQWQFTTTPLAPNAPVLSSPEDGASNQPVDLILFWEFTMGATSYIIQVSTETNYSVLLINETAAISKALTGLNNNSTYYWRVKALNSGGESPWTSRYFTTIPAVADAPVLAYPTNNAENVGKTLGLTWNAMTGATSYDIQVSLNPEFSTTFVDENVVDTIKNMEGLSEATAYYWRVRSNNVAGSSAWATAQFMTAPPTTAIRNLTTGFNITSARTDARQVTFTLATARDVNFAVYTLQGHTVYALNKAFDAGWHAVSLANLAQGSYVVIFKAGEYQKKSRLIFTK